MRRLALLAVTPRPSRTHARKAPAVERFAPVAGQEGFLPEGSRKTPPDLPVRLRRQSRRSEATGRPDCPSHEPQRSLANVAGQEGFEPPSPGFGVRCSSRSSYWPDVTFGGGLGGPLRNLPHRLRRQSQRSEWTLCEPGHYNPTRVSAATSSRRNRANRSQTSPSSLCFCLCKRSRSVTRSI